jgi:hypothetical protein
MPALFLELRSQNLRWFKNEQYKFSKLKTQILQNLKSPTKYVNVWFFRYFRRKIQWKIWRFWLKTKLNYAKFWSWHWFLRKTPIFSPKLVENCDHNIDPRYFTCKSGWTVWLRNSLFWVSVWPVATFQKFRLQIFYPINHQNWSKNLS